MMNLDAGLGVWGAVVLDGILKAPLAAEAPVLSSELGFFLLA
jgi:hypothetical protein